MLLDFTTLTYNSWDLFCLFQGEKRKKPKYVYKTADEIIATGGKKKTVIQSELAKVKVIDMTGREKRVLSGQSECFVLTKVLDQLNWK